LVQKKEARSREEELKPLSLNSTIPEFELSTILFEVFELFIKYFIFTGKEFINQELYLYG
jgi:hypothetical protein